MHLRKLSKPFCDFRHVSAPHKLLCKTPRLASFVRGFGLCLALSTPSLEGIAFSLWICFRRVSSTSAESIVRAGSTRLLSGILATPRLVTTHRPCIFGGMFAQPTFRASFPLAALQSLGSDLLADGSFSDRFSVALMSCDGKKKVEADGKNDKRREKPQRPTLRSIASSGTDVRYVA